MRFKLLHVRPHVWLFKQQETLASKASNDDNSSTDHGPFVYKRSTSLKLVKSDPSSATSRKDSGSPSNVGKLPSIGTVLSSSQAPKAGKNVQVCTVVDAGCTCRASVTSQHKQKRAQGSSAVSSRDVGSFHDVCRPRRSHVLETKGERDNAATGLHAKSMSSSSRSPITNGSMVSRLVCKSSHDVIKHAQLDAERSHAICTLTSHDEGTLDVEQSRPMNAAGQVKDAESSAVQMDVHELECRLRNAGLEERRRSTKKKKKNKHDHEEDDSVASSEVSSSLGTSGNAETIRTSSTNEMQDMLVNLNPAFDMDSATPGSRAMSLDDLRASIAQRKLAHLSPQASPHIENEGLVDGLRESLAFTGSPSSLNSSRVGSVDAASPLCTQSPNRRRYREKLEVSIKHLDVGANKRRSLSESYNGFNQGLAKQSHRASINIPSKLKESPRNDETTPRRNAEKRDRGMRQEPDTSQRVNPKSRVNRCLTQENRHGLNRNTSAHEANSKVVGHGLNRNTHAHGANIKEAGMDVLGQDGHGILSYRESDIGQEKQMVSSSSCEIQVLSDCNHDNHSDSGHDNYPMLRVHVGGKSSASEGGNAGACANSQDGGLGHELMQNQSAVAMVKSSYDPRRDFKESMLEMVAAKRLRTPRQLQQLLQCYLSLNPTHYHPIIIKVFHDLCAELFR